MLLPSHALALTPCVSTPRVGCIRCWTGETSATVVVKVPAAICFSAYADIGNMPRWSPMLESVVLVDPVARRSEWALRVPRPLVMIAEATGFANLVRWEATHDIEPGQTSSVLRWRSLSGVENSGEAVFVENAGDGVEATTVTLTMSYTLPDMAGRLVDTGLAQRFVRKTMSSTMEKFRTALEAEHARSVLEAGVQETGVEEQRIG